MRVTHLSTQGPKFTAEIDTKFEPSPKGLLLLELDSFTRNPPTAPGKYSIMRTTYAGVDGFQVPASLAVDTRHGTVIQMQFTHCGVKR